jgi:hypothetical protein
MAVVFGAPENQVYGNSAILNHYAGLVNKSIRGRYQHGWAAHSESDLYYLNDFLPTFVWSQEAENRARTQGWSNFKSIGAPWIYLLEILKGDGWNTNLSSLQTDSTRVLWVYGRHGLGDREIPGLHMLKFLQEVNEKASPGDLCLLYFEDFDSLSKSDFSLFANLEIVTLGQRSSSFISDSHLLRLYQILRSVSQINIDHPSTLTLYSLTLGVKVCWIRNQSWAEASQKAKDLKLTELYDFMNTSIESSLIFRDFAFKKLGISSLKSREELRKVLGWDHRYFYSLFTIILALKTLFAFPLRFIRSRKKSFDSNFKSS